MSIRYPVAVLSVILLVAAAGIVPRAAHATDGVIEINASSMAAGMPSIGDAPGPPLTIAQPGSYVLTSDLFVTGANENVVEITSSHVTLDLNGFAIRCAWVFTPCKGTGTGVGIYSQVVQDLTVRNGTVYDMADHGIQILGKGAVVQNVRALDNGGMGIDVGAGGLIEHCTALGNGGSYGIAVGGGGIVRDSTARDNDQYGIAGSYGALLVGDTASGQTSGTGFVCSNCTIEDSVSYSNNKGIGANDSLIRNNTVTLNVSVGVSGTGATVVGNRIVDNGGFGIEFAGTYGGNTLTGNNAGAEIQSSTPGVEIDTNFCGTDTVCP